MKATIRNCAVEPHRDDQRGFTVSQLDGTYSGPRGAGRLYAVDYGMMFSFSSRSLLILKANNFEHGVGLWNVGWTYVNT